MAVQAAGEGGLLRRPTLGEGDIIIVRGDATAAASLAAAKHLALRSEDSTTDVTETLFNRQSGLAEVVIPPRSAFIGQAVFPGKVIPSGDLVVLAVQRRGEVQGSDATVLAEGVRCCCRGPGRRSTSDSTIRTSSSSIRRGLSSCAWRWPPSPHSSRRSPRR